MPIATPIPMGPTRNAVTGTRIMTEIIGTNTICSIEGITFFRKRSSGASKATASSGGKT